MAKPVKILLVNLFSNGDCLYATTVAKQIKFDNPGCHLTWAIADYCKDIILNNPNVDERLVIKGIDHVNWMTTINNFKKQIQQWKDENTYDKIYFPQIIDLNYANYDQCLRSSIFRGYDKPITVDIQPVLELTSQEKELVENFANKNDLQNYTHVILMEFSPRSGQADFPLSAALSLAEKLIKNTSIAVILSSNKAIETTNKAIIDGSTLSLRQTAHISKYCTLLIGCSSGITWVTTTTAGKKLPMLQILNPNAYWFNSVANDYKRFKQPTDHIIEVSDSLSAEKIFECVSTIINDGFTTARNAFNTELPIKFKMTRGIICYLLIRGKIKETFNYIQLNLKIFGWNPKLVKAIILGITTFPIVNFWNKRKEQKALKLAKSV